MYYNPYDVEEEIPNEKDFYDVMRERKKALLLDITKHKEFVQYAPPMVQKTSNIRIDGYTDARIPLKMSGLRLHGAQLFVQNFCNPKTPYKRILLNWLTGVGKTLGMLTITLEFFKSLPSDSTAGILILAKPNIRTMILNELLMHPEFGFVTYNELLKLEKMVTQANTELSRNHLRGYLGYLRRRIMNKMYGGFYKFWGYQEFAQRLLKKTHKGEQNNFNLQQIFEAKDDVTTLLQKLKKASDEKLIYIDVELLSFLRGGMIVVDEVQNIYNVMRKNNYGIAIQYVLDLLGTDIRAIFMSATPMSGAASESIDLLNIIIPKDYLPGRNILEKKDFFVKTGELREDALEKIGILSAGYVSFVIDADQSAYPQRIFDGVKVPSKRYPDGIPYLFFQPCIISPFHKRAFDKLNNMLAGGKNTIEGQNSPQEGPNSSISPPEDTGATKGSSLPIGSFIINDMVFPSPTNEPIFTIQDVKKLFTASDAWKKEVGIVTEKSTGINVISGEFLQLKSEEKGSPKKTGLGVFPGEEKEPNSFSTNAFADKAKGLHGLEFYSSKYAQMLRDVIDFIKAGPGKIMIYHQYVQGGIILIQEILKMNGFIKYQESATAFTRCSICFKRKQHHDENNPSEAFLDLKKPSKKENSKDNSFPIDNAFAGVSEGKGFKKVHAFIPLKFITAHYAIDKNQMKTELDIFNNPANNDGNIIRIIVGSRIIAEGVTIKAVKLQLIMAMPTDISSLIQVFGRIIRRGSHLTLPVDERLAHIKIYVSQFSPEMAMGVISTPEIEKYSEKIHEYLKIQQVEKCFRQWAIDSFIIRPNIEKTIAPFRQKKPTLETLYYDQIIEFPTNYSDIQFSATFNAFGYGVKETITIKNMIVKLLQQRAVWTYEDLWEIIRNEKISGIYENTQLFDEKNFACALMELMTDPLTDYCMRLIYIEPYFFFCSVDEEGNPIIDFQYYLRQKLVLRPLKVSINDYITDKNVVNKFDVQVGQMLQKYEIVEKKKSFPKKNKKEKNYDIANMKWPYIYILYHFDADFHYQLLENIILKVGTINLPENSAQLNHIVDIYKKFFVLLDGSFFEGSSDIIGQKDAPKEKFIKAKNIAYVTIDSIKIYWEGKWAEISKTSSNLKTPFLKRFNENNYCVGWIEEKKGRLKIRPPLHILQAEKIRDVRALHRGKICSFFEREKLECLACKIGALSATRVAQLSVPNICDFMYEHLLKLEEKERQKGMHNSLRWFYLFNDRTPVISLIKKKDFETTSESFPLEKVPEQIKEETSGELTELGVSPPIIENLELGAQKTLNVSEFQKSERQPVEFGAPPGKVPYTELYKKISTVPKESTELIKPSWVGYLAKI